MKNWVQLTLAAVIFFSSTKLVSAANSYYVATTGSDTAPGTLAAPWKTIGKGITSMSAGDTLYVRGGTYSSFTVARSGSAGSPLTISGYNNEFPIISGGTGIKTSTSNHVVIRGFEVTSVAAGAAGAIIVGGSNTTIDGNKVHDNVGTPTNGIVVNGSNNKIINNDVWNNNFAGIRLYGTGATGNEVAYNKAHHNTLSAGNSDGINCSGGGSQNNIHHNQIYNNTDDGIDVWVCPNNTISHNIAHHNGGTGDGNGLKLGGGGSEGGNNIVKNNISYSNLSDGFTSNSSGGNMYYNNVAYNNAVYGFSDGWRTTPPDDQSKLINNVGYGNGVADVSLASGMTSASHNNLWGSKLRWNGSIITTLSSFYAASGFDNPNGGNLASLQVDPKFTNPATADFTLLSNSPLINKGDTSNPAQVAAVGVPDIGAFEYGSTLPPLDSIVPGDLNNDDLVNARDYTLLLAGYGTTYDLADYNTLIANYSR